MIKMTIQDAEETAEFKVLEKPIVQKPLIAESDVVTIDNNLSTYVTGTQKRELTVGLGYLDSVGYEALRRIRDRQYAVLKYPTVTITADEPIEMGYGEDVPDYRQRLVQLKGKNLFDKDHANIRNGYLYNNKLTYMATYGDRAFILPCEPNTTYTISRSILTSSFRAAYSATIPSEIPATSSSTQNLQCYGEIDNNSGSTITITTDSSANSLIVHYGNAVNDSNINESLATIQVELGSTSTTYESYYDIELCKIGDYQDKIYKDGDDWKLYKAIYKIVLDGVQNNAKFTERMTANNSKYRFRFTNSSALPANFTSGTVAPMYCDKFIGVTMGNTWNSVQGICYNDVGNSMIASIESLQTSTLEQANTWLGSNNLTVYYVLATPTTTTITNTVLISQLESLTESAFDRWTKVETEVPDGNLKPTLTVTQGTLSGTGKEVMLDGTTEDLLDFVIFGDTFQQTYSGKNLWPINSSIATYNCTITPGDNSLTIVATGVNSNIYPHFYLDANTQYTFSGEFKITNYVGASPIGVVLQGYNGSSWVVIEDDRTGVSDTNTHTFSVSFNSASYRMVRVGFGTNAYNTSVANTVVLSNPQLEKGSAATSFEPYVGGVPAPNPEYPQEVRTVNGNINFDFSGPSGVKKYTMVGKMTLAEQRIIDYCGTNEQVQVSFRESKQL